MSADGLVEHFSQVVEAPEGVRKLTQFILDLAVRGKLVPQVATDEPVAALLDSLQEGKRQLIRDGIIKSTREGVVAAAGGPPFEVPNTWVWCRLSEVGAVIGGGTPASGNPTYFTEGGSGIAWLTPADLGRHEGAYVSHGARDLTPDGLKNSSATLMPRGTVVFTSRAPIGYTAIAANPVSTNQGFKSVVPFVADCSGYIAVFFRAFASSIDAAAPGTTFREVSGKIVSNLWFPLPPLSEQRRIVAKVDELMALCVQLEDANAKRDRDHEDFVASSFYHLAPALEDVEANQPDRLEVTSRLVLSNVTRLVRRARDVQQARSAVLRLAVNGRLSAQLEEDGSAAECFPDLAPSALPEGCHRYPDSWLCIPLGAIGGWMGGGTPDKTRGEFWGGEIPWVRPKDMKRLRIRDSLDHITPAALTGSSARLIPKGSLLMVVRGMILARTFPVALTEREVTVNQDMKALVPRDARLTEFLLLVLQAAEPAVLNAVTHATHGTCKLASVFLEQLPVGIPPLPELMRILATVEAAERLCDELDEVLRAQVADKDRLLDAFLASALQESR